MDNVIYIGLSRQRVLEHEIEVISNNVANVDTTGFKVESLTVQTDSEHLSSDPTSPLLSNVNFPLDAGVMRDFSQGELKATGGPLNMAIQGQGFFRVSTANGERYTRDGAFTLDAQGRIVTAAGDPVQGDGLYANDTNLQPTPSTAQIRQGMLEQSNVQGITQITRLIEVSRAYETISQMMDQTSQLSSSAVDRLGRISSTN